MWSNQQIYLAELFLLFQPLIPIYLWECCTNICSFITCSCSHFCYHVTYVIVFSLWQVLLISTIWLHMHCFNGRFSLFILLSTIRLRSTILQVVLFLVVIIQMEIILSSKDKLGWKFTILALKSCINCNTYNMLAGIHT